jgi:hypothetical protein
MENFNNFERDLNLDGENKISEKSITVGWKEFYINLESINRKTLKKEDFKLSFLMIKD